MSISLIDFLQQLDPQRTVIKITVVITIGVASGQRLDGCA